MRSSSQPCVHDSFASIQSPCPSITPLVFSYIQPYKYYYLILEKSGQGFKIKPVSKTV